MADEFVVAPHESRYLRFVLPIFRFVGAFFLFCFGPLKVSRADRIPRQGGLLILSNHLADVDPIVVQYGCPRPIRFMSKSELFDMPVVGGILRLSGAFGVRRGEADRRSLKFAVDLLKSGEVVGIFPEGQLSETGELQPLKGGVALIARMAGVPVICCRLIDTQRIMPYGTVIPRPSFRRISLIWGEPRTITKQDSPEGILAWAESEFRNLGDLLPPPKHGA